VSPLRRRWLRQLALWASMPSMLSHSAVLAQATETAGVQRGRALAFPRDHGAHLATRIEWWYATGWLGTQDRPTHGFQLTFFRSRTGLAASSNSRFAARHLLFAHAAASSLGSEPGTGKHVHDQRVARWSGDPEAARGAAQLARGAVRLQGWSLVDAGQAWQARIPAGEFDLDLQLARSQAILLQGEAGFSRKGPDERQASHYYSEPQLAVSGTVHLHTDSPAQSTSPQQGRAWLDHEWSDEILHPQAVGWDWIGINLFDGSALTAFVLRRADGSALWAGGSWRPAGQPAQAFGPEALRFTPGRRWRSPASAANYPVEWTIDTPAGRFALRALMDAQELDGRGSTGTVYWEGLSELRDAQGRRVGLGYLEMTGYAGRLVLG
jgi:predicted secreted hydrolase